MFEKPGGYDYVAYCIEDLPQTVQVSLVLATYIVCAYGQNVDPIR